MDPGWLQLPVSYFLHRRKAKALKIESEHFRAGTLQVKPLEADNTRTMMQQLYYQETEYKKVKLCIMPRLQSLEEQPSYAESSSGKGHALTKGYAGTAVIEMVGTKYYRGGGRRWQGETFYGHPYYTIWLTFRRQKTNEAHTELWRASHWQPPHEYKILTKWGECGVAIFTKHANGLPSLACWGNVHFRENQWTKGRIITIGGAFQRGVLEPRRDQ